MAASKTLSPAQRTERARNAGHASQSTDTLINRLVARAPALTDEQRARLAALLAPSAG